MTDWEEMFHGVRKIVQSASTFEAGLKQTIEFAPSICRHYDHQYWKQAGLLIQQPSIISIVSWAIKGLAEYSASGSWNFLLLDLGDSPEIFWLHKFERQSLFSESKLRNLVLSESIIDYAEFADCLATEVTDPIDALFEEERQELIYHNVRELEDSILSWNLNSLDYQGDNGYLLWLAVGTLALLEPLRNKEFCQQILKGQKKLYLLPGFEEIFFYLATVTPEGLLFENEQPSILE